MNRHIIKLAKFVYFFACFFVILSCKGQAYVDATSVTYIVQAVVGLFVALGAVITVQRHKIIAAYRKWHYGRLAKKTEERALKEMQIDSSDNRDSE